MHPMVNIAIKAARSAGEIILRHIYKLDNLNITEKQQNDFVSEVDIKSEQVIIDTIRKAYPRHAIMAEESGYHEASEEYVWIIDPLDGTLNYLHGFPHFCVSIGVQVKDRIEHAVVFDPLNNECFSASRGDGARCNERRIRVSSRQYLNEALLGTGLRTNNSSEKLLPVFNAFFGKCSGIRNSGSAALDLAYVAAGRLDGFWHAALQPWDMAAGSLLIKEAGGLVGDFSGGENSMKTGTLAAGNPKIFKALLQTLQPLL